jgi:hypothetical protein
MLGLLLTFAGIMNYQHHLRFVLVSVRATSCLILYLNIFINVLIANLRRLDNGCHLYCQFVVYLLYAYDIILLCFTLNGLQHYA